MATRSKPAPSIAQPVSPFFRVTADLSRVSSGKLLQEFDAAFHYALADATTHLPSLLCDSVRDSWEQRTDEYTADTYSNFWSSFKEAAPGDIRFPIQKNYKKLLYENESNTLASLDNVVFCKPFKKFKERCETLKSACLTELNTYVTEVNTLMESEDLDFDEQVKIPGSQVYTRVMREEQQAVDRIRKHYQDFVQYIEDLVTTLTNAAASLSEDLVNAHRNATVDHLKQIKTKLNNPGQRFATESEFEANGEQYLHQYARDIKRDVIEKLRTRYTDEKYNLPRNLSICARAAIGIHKQVFNIPVPEARWIDIGGDETMEDANGADVPAVAAPGPAPHAPGMPLPGLPLPGLQLPGLQLPGLQLPGLQLPGLPLPTTPVASPAVAGAAAAAAAAAAASPATTPPASGLTSGGPSTQLSAATNAVRPTEAGFSTAPAPSSGPAASPTPTPTPASVLVASPMPSPVPAASPNPAAPVATPSLPAAASRGPSASTAPATSPSRPTTAAQPAAAASSVPTAAAQPAVGVAAAAAAAAPSSHGAAGSQGPQEPPPGDQIPDDTEITYRGRVSHWEPTGALKLNDPGQGAVDVWRDSAGRPGIGVKREEDAVPLCLSWLTRQTVVLPVDFDTGGYGIKWMGTGDWKPGHLAYICKFKDHEGVSALRQRHHFLRKILRLIASLPDADQLR